MGYECSHAIIVTTYDEDAMIRAHAEAHAIFDEHGPSLVSPIVASWTNHRHSFFIAPDGSKEGWPESAAGDTCRAHFISWLKSQAFKDGSSVYDWVEVQYGDDDGDHRVLQASR